MKLQSKLPDLGINIFTTMTRLALDHKAINLSQGFPDFEVSPRLVELVAKYMRDGANQYAPMQGAELLRVRISEKVKDLYQASYDPGTEITITSGATESLFAAIATVVRPGDEVIVVEPAYDCYVPAIQLSGGIPVFLQLKFPGYAIDWNEFADALTPRTRLIILNSPHNPTGSALSDEDIAALTEIVTRSEAWLVSDEVYEHIVFDGQPHRSLTRYPQLAQRSFVISSFGKTYHTTGWKVGYCLAPEPLTREFRKIHQYLTFSTNTPVQLAYAEFMQDKDVYSNLPAFYQERRDFFVNLIRPSRFKALPCRGTYFQMLDYSEITDEPDSQFAQRLTAEHGVAAIPPSVFYHAKDDHKVLRFCFAKKDDTLVQAAERLNCI